MRLDGGIFIVLVENLKLRYGNMEHRDSAERAAFNKFKRVSREAHIRVKRNIKYYNAVNAADKAQHSTLDPWLSIGLRHEFRRASEPKSAQ